MAVLTGKVALVTGASQGAGRAVADRARDSGRKYILPEDVADAVCFLLTQPDRAWTQEMSLWPF